MSLMYLPPEKSVLSVFVRGFYAVCQGEDASNKGKTCELVFT